MEIVLYLPVNTQLIADRNTRSFHRNESRYRDILDVGDEGKLLVVTSSGTKCLDCATTPPTTSTTKTFDVQDNTFERIEIITEEVAPSNSWEEEVNNSIEGTTKKVKKVKVKVNDSLQLNETIIIDN
jgi:hypothetical protein